MRDEGKNSTAVLPGAPAPPAGQGFPEQGGAPWPTVFAAPRPCLAAHQPAPGACTIHAARATELLLLPCPKARAGGDQLQVFQELQWQQVTG